MKRRFLVAILVLATWSSASIAQDDGNKFILAPYLWGTSLDGTSTVGTLPSLDVDASFSDLLSNLNFGLSLHTEFHTGPWRFALDPTYLSLGIDIPPLLPNQAGPKMDVTVWLVEAWAGYAFTDNWEVLAGLRYQDQDLELSGLPSPPFTSSRAAGDSWSDWFAGVRFHTDLGAKWLLVARGDVVFAGDSDSGYNVEVFFNRRFGESMALNLGYRYLDNDYDNPDVYAWDMVQQGPIVGYTWAF